ncbi:hypothetical protein ACO22_05482 [Paracoccidioides brasiliensis]|uniref:Methyltransferase n=1 Tax=Paracoccidioides brasiliensis TaxID=121759 RepID=A0A1D2JAA6_PARBR|nr:hypothetical protein ACO22_05482 [Paracoccidioides brasiliensis]
MAQNMTSNGVAAIEIDKTIDDGIALYEESVNSTIYATSIDSCVLDYKCEVAQSNKRLRVTQAKSLFAAHQNGRRYHAFHEGAYILPNDEAEQIRMDLEHHIYRMILAGELYRAPLKPNPKRVLDFGTGNGNWAIDFANQHPESKVIGSDLSPIQPTWVPPNCSFEIDDVETEWPYKSSKAFNYIHSRNMAGSIKDFDNLFAQAFKHLQPGGYLEMQSFEAGFFSDDGTLENAQSALKWKNLLIEASNKFGKPLDVEGTWEKKMSKAGFVDIKNDVYKVPVYPWPKNKKLKEIAQYQQLHLTAFLEAYTLALFTRVLKWDKKEIDILLEAVKKDLQNRSNHIYGKIHVIYGRKQE